MQIEYLSDFPQHLDTVLDWRYSEWARNFAYPEKRLWREKLVTQCGRGSIPSVLIALENGEPVGTAALVENDMTVFKELSPWLSGVYIKEEKRRQGIAALLVARVEEMGRMLGCKSLFLFTFDKDAYYRKLGWKEIRKDAHLGMAVSIMEKPLI